MDDVARMIGYRPLPLMKWCWAVVTPLVCVVSGVAVARGSGALGRPRVAACALPRAALRGLRAPPGGGCGHGGGVGRGTWDGGRSGGGRAWGRPWELAAAPPRASSCSTW